MAEGRFRGALAVALGIGWGGVSRAEFGGAGPVLQGADGVGRPGEVVPIEKGWSPRESPERKGEALLENGDCEAGIPWLFPGVHGLGIDRFGPAAWKNLHAPDRSQGTGLRWCRDPDGGSTRGRVLGVARFAPSSVGGGASGGDSGHASGRALGGASPGAASDRRIGWCQEVPVSDSLGKSLLLRFDLRALRLHPAAMACARIQVLGEQGGVLASAWSERCVEAGPWARREVLVDLPAGALTARVELYLVGSGEVYFDRLRLSPSEREGGDPRPFRGGYEGLARGAAGDLPWAADLESALERAAREGKPVLVYVRSIDHPEGMESARSSITANGVPLSDDGLRKDLLMRAGPLSDPDVRDLIRERFVPVVVTYGLLRDAWGEGAEDPLLDLGHRAKDVVAPAFLVLDPRGATVWRMHRFGALGPRPLDAELRWALDRCGVRAPWSTEAEDLYRAGELDAALMALGSRRDEGARCLRARVLLREGHGAACLDGLVGLGGGEAMHLRGCAHLGLGRFEEAEASFRAASLLGGLSRPRHNEFLRAWSLARLGRWEEAALGFDRLVGHGFVGRRAAACLLPRGPHLWLAGSEALAVGFGGVDSPGAHASVAPGSAVPDPRRSLAFLLGCQATDGSFGSHEGLLGRGPDRPAITALVGLALAGLGDRVDVGTQPSVHASLGRAEAFLVGWARDASKESKGGVPVGLHLQAPYVIEFLLARGRRGTATLLVEVLSEGQRPHGGWSHYGRGEVEAFTTGLALRALHRAAEAGIPVEPEVFERGAVALEGLRSEDDCFAYSDRPGREWAQTPVGGLGRDVLCADALLICLERIEGATALRAGSEPSPPESERLLRARRGFDRAIARFLELHPLLDGATRRWADYFDSRGLASYFFFTGHHAAMVASRRLDGARRREFRNRIRDAVLAAREFDDTWVDHVALGRAYGTAMAWILLTAP